MYCIKTEIPKEICEIDDELKALYHSKDTVCIWVLKTREDRNKFMDETAGMLKSDREKHYGCQIHNLNYKSIQTKVQISFDV